MHLADALDRLPVGRAHPVPHGGEIDGAVRDEPFAIGELGQTGLADDDARARALEPAAHRLAEAERRGRGDRLHGVRAVGAHGRGRRAVEVDVGGRGHRGRQRHALVDDLPVHALARRVQHAGQEHDVAELEVGERGVGDRRGEVHLVHRHVVEPLGNPAVPRPVRHSIASRR